MDQSAVRVLTTQLAEDLAWLESHAGQVPGQTPHEGLLRMAAGLVRNVLAPFVEGQPALPLHVAVVGGAGAGKSTVANLLIGSMQAESNPQAGYTRHPIAFASSEGPLPWPASLGFLGPMLKLAGAEPARLDRDVYQVRRVAVPPDTLSVLGQYVVWDCPDMTTWAASNYVQRMLEVSALADVVVYVASDERYNDEVPTEYFRMFLEAGKAVIVVLVKMRETDVKAFLDHFNKEVVARMPGKPVVCLAIPQLTQEQLVDPIRRAPTYRIPILNQLSVLAQPPRGCRSRTVRSALYFLTANQERLLAVAKNDLDALDLWKRTVQQGQTEFEERYRREFLTSEKFRRFDEALVRLVDMLELPGIGRFLSGAMNFLSMPYKIIKSWFSRPSQPDAKQVAERVMLDSALQGWSDHLRKEAAFRADGSKVWKHIHRGFQTGLTTQINQRFERSVQTFQISLNEEVERTARAIFEDIQKRPGLLNTLRSAKFAAEAGVLVTAVLTMGVSLAALAAAPVLVSLTRYLVDYFGESYIEARKEEARRRQQRMVHDQITQPIADYLSQWPASDGSAYERLQMALRRIPANLQELTKAITPML